MQINKSHGTTNGPSTPSRGLSLASARRRDAPAHRGIDLNEFEYSMSERNNAKSIVIVNNRDTASRAVLPSS